MTGHDRRLRSLAAILAGLALVVLAGVLAVGPATVAGPAAGVGPKAGAAAADAAPPNPCVGTLSRPPASTTLVSIQGVRGGDKRDSLLVGVRPNGSVVGVHDESAAGRWWVYDVDPQPDGDLLVATTEPGISVIERVDPATGEHVTVDRLRNVEDAHDVDALGDGEFVTVDKGDGRNRVVVYNRTRGEIVWEWRFDRHRDRFPRDGGGPYGEDWTHVNDVDAIDDGVFVVSVRNFDTVVAIDRETKAVRWTLGRDDDHDVLFEQHNPDYLEGDGGTPTVLVADSRNDRVIEYARDGDGWTRTWVLAGGGLDEPRDADRLPNGHTLVTDRRGHRVLEVTPRGEVVWEFYTPWQPYDAERVGTGPGSAGPTMRQLGVEGRHRMRGSAGHDVERIESCYRYLAGWNGGSRLVPEDERWANGSRPLVLSPAGGSDAPTTVPPTPGPARLGPDVALLGVALAVAAIAAGVVFLRRR